MKQLIGILLILIILVLILDSIKTNKDDPFDTNLIIEIDKALKDTLSQDNEFSGNQSYVEVLNKKSKFYEQQMQLNVKMNKDYKTQAHISFWSIGENIPVTASAFGIDYLHHFVNNYLVGYEPFKAQNLWIPLYTLTMRLKYQLDADQYGGLKDVWQNSKQAFFNTRGDCEDHAIILADWLISMGLDARVVIGKYDKGGHAWVVVFRGSKVYLLEATSKRRYKNWKHYPLVDFQTKYHPYCMFNREYFWLNIGSIYTTRYTGTKWIKMSKFYRININ